jgi:hypothetical protein
MTHGRTCASHVNGSSGSDTHIWVKAWVRTGTTVFSRYCFACRLFSRVSDDIVCRGYLQGFQREAVCLMRQTFASCRSSKKVRFLPGIPNTDICPPPTHESGKFSHQHSSAVVIVHVCFQRRLRNCDRLDRSYLICEPEKVREHTDRWKKRRCTTC